MRKVQLRIQIGFDRCQHGLVSRNLGAHSRLPEFRDRIRRAQRQPRGCYMVWIQLKNRLNSREISRSNSSLDFITRQPAYG